MEVGGRNSSKVDGMERVRVGSQEHGPPSELSKLAKLDSRGEAKLQ